MHPLGRAVEPLDVGHAEQVQSARQGVRLGGRFGKGVADVVVWNVKLALWAIAYFIYGVFYPLLRFGKRKGSD